MKLYLSSQGFGNHVKRLKQMVGNDRRVLFIDNAKDYLPADEREAHVNEKKLEFETEGFDFFELDLRQYFGEPEKLLPIMEVAPFVWVSGGNTFILRRAFAQSGFDALVGNALKARTLTYGGSSAGSILMTQSLKGTELADEPYTVPEYYNPDVIWDGLGLIYPQLIPHYETDGFKEPASAMAAYFDANNIRYEILRDGDVYIVDGDYEEVLR